MDNKKHIFTTNIYPASFQTESYNLFKKYQKVIHKSDENVEKYTRFLVDNPLIYKDEKKTGFKPGIGAFHMEFRIDNKLIALSVIDILTDSLSSVYAFYDTDYNFLELGKFTALKEIELTKSIPTMKYYMLGYYNPTTQKLKYKAEYQPCELLCDVEWKYYPYKAAYELLKKNNFKYTLFCPNSHSYKNKKESIIKNKCRKYERSDILELIFKFIGFDALDEFEIYI